jgi:predicted exporter
LVALPGLVGALVRLPYTFAVPKFGGRNWTVVASLLLFIPTLSLVALVQRPETPFWLMAVAAASAGLGGGNFASSMANISFFYPDREKGLALGLNAVLVAAYRRRVRDTVLTVVPTALALLAVVGGVALLAPFNFLHLVSLLLILAMGIDYAVFLVGAGRGAGGNDRAVASRSVLLSALTTAASYGALAVCQTPALAGIGATVGAGIVLVCGLTFLAGLLAVEGEGA